MCYVLGWGPDSDVDWLQKNDLYGALSLKITNNSCQTSV